MPTAARALRFLLQFLLGFAVVGTFALLPYGGRMRAIAWWARGTLAALGVGLVATGDSRAGAPGLLVANHISWLDVLAIAAVRPALFVCKSEVAGWPLIGWLLRRSGTVFIRRRAFRDVLRVNDELRGRFAEGESVVVFPEATTTFGETLPFRPALFQPAVDRALPVYPVAIAYSSSAAAFVGDVSFAASLWSVLRARDLAVRIVLLAPMDTRALTRRQAAARSRERILAARLPDWEISHDRPPQLHGRSRPSTRSPWRASAPPARTSPRRSPAA